MSTKIQRISELESLRGLMALWVVVGHILYMVSYSGYSKIWVAPFLANGNAVDVFMILSGFVIFNLIDNSREPFFVYIKRRFFRLFPLYAVCLILSALSTGVAITALESVPFFSHRDASRLHIFHNSVHYFWPQLLTHLTMLHGLLPRGQLPSSDYAFIGQAWSISVEWQFYILAPLLFFVLARSKYNLIGFSFCFFVLYVGLKLSPMFGAAFIGPHLYYFLVGIISYYIWKKQDKLAQFSNLNFGLFGASISIFVIISFLFDPPLAIWIAVISSLIFHNMGLKSRFGRPIASILQFKPIRYLGKISYSIYLSHMLVLYLVVYCAGFIGFDGKFSYLFFLLTLTLLGTIIFSHFLYEGIERPFIRFGKSFNLDLKIFRKTP